MIVQTYVISISLVLLIYTQIIANLKSDPFHLYTSSMVAPQSKRGATAYPWPGLNGLYDISLL